MNEILLMTRLELGSLYGINRFLYTKDKKEKNRFWLQGCAWVLVIAMVAFYTGGLAWGLCFLGLGEIVPAYLTVLSSMLILAFGIFTAGSRIFGQRGYDILMSMPIKSRSIVAGRFLCLYAEDLLFTLVILLPGFAVYGICQQPGIGFYLLAALIALLIPGIPLVLSVLLGTVILAVSSRMKRRSLAQTLLSLALVVAVLAGSFGLTGVEDSSISPEQLASLAQSISGLLGKIYSPAVWVGEALIHGSVAYLGLFCGVSVAAVAAALVAVSRFFQAISRGLRNVSARHDYKIGTMESRSLCKALWIREGKRYFSSSVYVTNTIIGPILGAIMAVALCVVGMDAVTGALGASLDVPGLLPFAFSAVFCMMNTTCVSISMEGKEFWAIKSLPIPTKALLDSKVLLNLSLMAPFYLVSVVSMAIATRADWLQLVWLALIPAGISLFSVVLGITVNLRFRSFDWEKEETVVKQSLPAMLGGFAGFLLAVALGLLVSSVPAQYADGVKLIVCAALFLGTALLRINNNKTNLACL